MSGAALAMSLMLLNQQMRRKKRDRHPIEEETEGKAVGCEECELASCGCEKDSCGEEEGLEE